MRNALSLVGLSLVTVLGVPSYAGAAPISYEIEFTLGPGDWGNVSGSFVYDSDAPEFSDFHVTWGPQFFDLTDSANAASFGAGVSGCTQGPACAFAVLTDALAEPHENTWTALQTTHAYSFTFFQTFFDSGTTLSIGFEGSYATPQLGNSTNTGRGTWSVTAAGPESATPGASSITPTTPVPEPGTLGLLLVGALGLTGSRLRQSTRKTQ